MSVSSEFTLQRTPLGQLSLTDNDGVTHDNVVPVRAHPISAPEEGIALVSQEGHELVWIDQLSDLPAAQREMVTDGLHKREFMPEITRLVGVSSFATPSTWEVETNRGLTRFVLKGEEDIRRMPNGILLISDAHGIQFMIRKLADLDRHSRRLLDRFL